MFEPDVIDEIFRVCMKALWKDLSKTGLNWMAKGEFKRIMKEVS